MLRRLFDRFRSRKLEAPPVPKPSDIAAWAASAPRAQRKRDKMAVRRQYRSPLPMSSVQRQILAEMVAGQVFADKERQEEEDIMYGATVNGQPLQRSAVVVD